MLAPTSKSPEEREFVVDSGASMHMMSKKDLSSHELDTSQRSRNPTVVLTTNGEVHTNEEAQVYVHDLNPFVTVQLLEETPAVLSLGKLCEDHGYSCEWISGQKPRLTKEEKTIVCKTDNFVPLVVPGLSTSSGSNSSSTSTSQDLSLTSPAQERSDGLAPREWCGSPFKNPEQKKKRDGSRDADDRLRDLPEWLEEFTDNLEDTELHAPAHISQDSDIGTSCESGQKSKSRKHSIYTHFPKDRNCEVCKGSLQKTHWRSSTSSRKVWWLDNGWSQGPQWGGWITEQSPVRCRCTRSCHSMDSILSVQNKDFTRDGKEFTKVPRAVAKTKVIYTDNSLEFGKSCEDLSWKIIELRHLIDPRQMALLESAVRRVKEGTSAVLLQSALDWKMVGWFYGMLWLSAKCPRPPGRRENSVWKTIWRTIQRANNSLWSNVWISPDFSTRSIKTSSIWQESLTWDLSWVWVDSGGNLERRYSDCGFGRFGKVARIRNSSSKNQRERSIDITKKGDGFIFPVADGTAKLSGRDYDFREPTVRWEEVERSGDFSGELQGELGRVSTDRTNRWRWRPCRLLVDSRWLLLSSSQWTSS